jgi:hypothetical protein
MQEAFWGAFSSGFFVAAAFFLRFWGRTREPLLLIFSLAFGVLALSYGFLAFLEIPREEQGWIYLMRLGAFTLIIVGIVWTNIRGRKS